MLNDLSSDESKRRAAIDLLKNADEGRDEALKKYTHLVCQLLKMPMSFVSILDDEKQYIKSAQNIAPTDTSLGGAFCEQTLKQGELSFVLIRISTRSFIAIGRSEKRHSFAFMQDAR